MQQFTVPQFIDVEDKVFGPITVRQFVIILFCGVLSVLAYRLFDLILFIIISFAIFIIGGIVAFLRVNGRPFHYFVLNVIQTVKKPKLRLWNNQRSKTKAELGAPAPVPVKEKPTPHKPRYGASKLAEVSLVVDTGGVYGGGDANVQPLKNSNAHNQL